MENVRELFDNGRIVICAMANSSLGDCHCQARPFDIQQWMGINIDDKNKHLAFDAMSSSVVCYWIKWTVRDEGCSIWSDGLSGKFSWSLGLLIDSEAPGSLSESFETASVRGEQTRPTGRFLRSEAPSFWPMNRARGLAPITPTHRRWLNPTSTAHSFVRQKGIKWECE